MITFFHAPMSRSTAIVTLIKEMGIEDQIEMRLVDISRIDGTGQRDPLNQHPEGKAPALLHEGRMITERGAVMLYLTTLFPGDMAPAVGTAAWGEFASWLTWYQGVVEPVMIFQATGLAHDWLTRTYRGPAEVAARIRAALERGAYLLGDTYSAADLLIHSVYAFFPKALPDDDLIRDWVARCQARPAVQAAKVEDLARLAAMRQLVAA